MFDKRNKLSDQVAADVREHMGDKVYNTVIPAQCADFRSAVAMACRRWSMICAVRAARPISSLPAN